MGFICPTLSLDSVPGETLVGHNQVVAVGLSGGREKTQDSLRKKTCSYGRNKPMLIANRGQKVGFFWYRFFSS